MGRKKKEIEIKTKKATPKKVIKKTDEAPMSIKEVTQPVEVKIEEEIKIAEEVLSSEEKDILKESVEEISKSVEEISKQALQETFKENNTRLIDRMFGYSWNGQEMDY